MKRPQTCVIFQVTDTERRSFLESVGATEKSVAEAVEAVRLWYGQQPHLPDVELDPARVERLYLLMKASIERTKQAIDLMYSMKTVAPDVFTNRDPTLPDIKKLKEILIWGTLRHLTKDRYRVSVCKVLDSPNRTIDWTTLFKVAFMCGEIRNCFDCSQGDMVICDMKHATAGNLANLSPAILKKMLVAAQDGLGARVKGVHYVNAPKYMDTFVNMIKPIMKPKLRSRLFVHTDMESFYKVFPKELLPTEYGGEGPSLQELHDDWNQALLDWRDWFLEEDHHKSDESRRPGKSNIDELLGIHGSFKKLDVD